MKKRTVYFDYLNAFACFAVVVMHVNSRFWNFTNDLRWAESLLIESFCYPAVGLFLMISGATLIDYRERYSTRVYVQKRLSRVVLPYAAWCLMAIVFHVFKGQLAWSDLTIANLCTWILNGSYYSVYWFFAPLFACYAAIPVLGAIEKDKRIRLFAYMAALSFFTICFAPMLARWTGVQWNVELNTPISAGYLIYPLLGYVLSRVEVRKGWRIAAYGLGIASLILRMVMTYRLSLRAGIIDYAYGTYLNFPCVFQAIAAFLAFKHARFENPKLNRIFRWLSGASFTVFLAHKFVMDLLDRFALEPHWMEYSGWHPILWPPVVYGLCLVLYAVGSRLPGVKRLFP